MSLDKAIEEAAKAMYAANASLPATENVQEWWNRLSPSSCELYLKMARAAYPVFREQMAQKLEAEAEKKDSYSYWDSHWMKWVARFLRESDR